MIMDKKHTFEGSGLKLEGTEEMLHELVDCIHFDETASNALSNIVSEIEMAFNWNGIYQNDDELNTKKKDDRNDDKTGKPKNNPINNTVIQFLFSTGDFECPYYQKFVLVEKEKAICRKTLEDSIVSYMESTETEDMEYDDIVKDIMGESDYLWTELPEVIPRHSVLYTFWI